MAVGPRPDGERRRRRSVRRPWIALGTHRRPGVTAARRCSIRSRAVGARVAVSRCASGSRPGSSVAAEPPRQLDVELVEVDVAHALEELGGPGVGQRFGQSVAPGLVFGLQLAELGQGRGPPRRPRLRPGRPPLLDGDAGETPSAAVGRRGRSSSSPTVPVGRELRRQRLADLTRRPVEPRREPASDGPPPRRPALRGPGRGAGVAPQDQPVALLGALTSRPPMGRALNLEPPRRHGEDPARTEPCVVVHGLDIGTVQESLHTSPRAGRTRSGPVLWSRRPGIAVQGFSGAFSGGAGRGEDGGGSGRFRSEAPPA